MVKESACNMGDLGSIPGLGRYPLGKGMATHSSSYLENPMDRGTWWATVHGVTKSQTQLSNSHFPVVMCGCESWTIKKAKHQRIDVFKLWCWRRLLRVPWTARRSNQSILKKINPEYSVEGLMLKLKLQYFGHLMRGADSLEKTLMLGKIEGKRRRRGDAKKAEMIREHHQLKGHELEQTPGDSGGQGRLVCCSLWGRKESDTT